MQPAGTLTGYELSNTWLEQHSEAATAQEIPWWWHRTLNNRCHHHIELPPDDAEAEARTTGPAADHLVWSVLTTLFCCPVFGLAAVMFSMGTRLATRNGMMF